MYMKIIKARKKIGKAEKYRTPRAGRYTAKQYKYNMRLMPPHTAVALVL